MLFEIKTLPSLAITLQRKVDSRLAKRGASEIEKLLFKRPKTMSLADYLQFRLLHRQFEGFKTPGFPTAVRAARYFYQKLKSCKNPRIH